MTLPVAKSKVCGARTSSAYAAQRGGARTFTAPDDPSSYEVFLEAVRRGAVTSSARGYACEVLRTSCSATDRVSQLLLDVEGGGSPIPVRRSAYCRNMKEMG